jgi:hypothetical protein
MWLTVPPELNDRRFKCATYFLKWMMCRTRKRLGILAQNMNVGTGRVGRTDELCNSVAAE